MPATNLVGPDRHLPASSRSTGIRKFIAAAGIAGALFAVSACSASGTAPSASSSAAAASATPTPTASLPYSVTAKGVANNGKGRYLQTSIADDDPSMQYDPAITDDAAKAHFSAAELAEAHKTVVRFIAEEGIDSTLSGGTDIDGWWAQHKDQIHPDNHSFMLDDLKAGKQVVDRQLWMAEEGASYVYEPETPRMASRLIIPQKLSYVQGSGLEGVKLETRVQYEMSVIKEKVKGKGKVKYPARTMGEMSYAVAKDPADGKWKIAGYFTNLDTTG